jgi:hypothetical protein
MTLDDSIPAFHLRVMRRAEELSNVTAACREAGITRTVFYRWRGRFERYGADGLHPRRRQAQVGGDDLAAGEDLDPEPPATRLLDDLRQPERRALQYVVRRTPRCRHPHWTFG